MDGQFNKWHPSVSLATNPPKRFWMALRIASASASAPKGVGGKAREYSTQRERALARLSSVATDRRSSAARINQQLGYRNSLPARRSTGAQKTRSSFALNTSHTMLDVTPPQSSPTGPGALEIIPDPTVCSPTVITSLFSVRIRRQRSTGVPRLSAQSAGSIPMDLQLACRDLIGQQSRQCK